MSADDISSVEDISGEALAISQTDNSLIEAFSAVTDLPSFSVSISISDSSETSESSSVYNISFYSRMLGRKKRLNINSCALRIADDKHDDLAVALGSFLRARDPLANQKFYNYPSLEFYVDPIHTIILKAIEGSSGPKARMSDLYALSALQCDPSSYRTEDTLMRIRLEAIYPLLSWVPQRSKAYLEPMLPVSMSRHLNLSTKLCMSQPLGQTNDESNEEANNETDCIRIQIGNKTHPFERVTSIPHLETTLLSKAYVGIDDESPVIVEFVCPVCSMELNVDEIIKELLIEHGISLLERKVEGLDLSDPDFPKDKYTLSKIEKAKEISVHEAVGCLRRVVSDLLREYFCRHLAKEKLRLQGIMCPDELMEGQYRIFVSELKRRLAEASL